MVRYSTISATSLEVASILAISTDLESAKCSASFSTLQGDCCSEGIRHTAPSFPASFTTSSRCVLPGPSLLFNLSPGLT
jgi:hypothetical protein